VGGYGKDTLNGKTFLIILNSGDYGKDTLNGTVF